MSTSRLKQTHAILLVTVISVIFNLLFFALFVLFFLRYPDKIIFLTMAFMLFYIVVAQPGKDYLVSLLIFKFGFPKVESSFKNTNKQKQLSTLRDVRVFLNNFLKKNNFEQIYIIFENKDKPFYFLRRDREFRTINPERYHVPEFIEFIKQNPQAKNLDHYPVHLQEVLKEQEWYAVVPIFFRKSIIGFLTLNRNLDKKQMQWLEKYSQRLGLIFENEYMAEKALGNKIFQKEYNTALKIENLLTIPSKESVGALSIVFPYLQKEKRPFPVIMEKSLFHSEVNKHVYLLCSLSKNPQRSGIMLLFAVQGYFFTACRGTKGLSGVCKDLNSLLVTSEAEILLDGALVEITNGGVVKLIPFGSHVSVYSSGKDVSYTTKPLGLSADFKIIEKNLKNNSSLKIKNQTMLHVGSK